MTGGEVLAFILSIVGALAALDKARQEGKKVDDAKVKVILETTDAALQELVAGLPAADAADNAAVDAERTRRDTAEKPVNPAAASVPMVLPVDSEPKP